MKTKESNNRGCIAGLSAGLCIPSVQPAAPVCRGRAEDKSAAGTTAAAGVGSAEARAWMETMFLMHRWEKMFGRGAVQRVRGSLL